MKWFLLLIALVSVASLSRPTPTRADTDVTHFKGQNVSARFSDVEGCVATDVVVGAAEGYNYTASETPKEVLSSAFLTVFQSDLCTGETLLDVFGDVQLSTTNAFSASRQSARLQATVDVFERVSGSFFDVTVDVRWTSSGELVLERQRIQDRPGCILNQWIESTNAPALATGSIIVLGTNMTPSPSVEALLQTHGDTMVGMDCPEPG